MLQNQIKTNSLCNKLLGICCPEMLKSRLIDSNHGTICKKAALQPDLIELREGEMSLDRLRAALTMTPCQPLSRRILRPVDSSATELSISRKLSSSGPCWFEEGRQT